MRTKEKHFHEMSWSYEMSWEWNVRYNVSDVVIRWGETS
jgi:hypothetical protein